MSEKRKSNYVSKKRIGYLILVAGSFLIGTLLLALHRKLYMDEVLCLLALDGIFLAVFFLMLLHGRMTGTLLQQKDTSYSMIALVIVLAWGCVIGFDFCPDYFAPVMILAVLLTAVLNDAPSMGLGIYFVCVLCFTGGVGVYVFYDYCILIVAGVFLGSILRNYRPSEAIEIYVIMLLLNVVVPIIFYYFAFLELTGSVFFYGIGAGLGVVFVTAAAFYPLSRRVRRNDTEIYKRILDEHYSLVQDIMHYSMAEYRHARKVSFLSHACAEEISANSDAAACGGFYYRLGKMEGEPEIDNALRLATMHCFPDDVIAILREYGGILLPPQTAESAIVHMVDALVTKIELLGEDTMSSTWNQDIVIYQTLNELSQTGIYDASGLSMNQFLKIRERLVREESIL